MVKKIKKDPKVKSLSERIDDKLLQILEGFPAQLQALTEKVTQLEEKLNRQPPTLPQKLAKPKRPKHLGEGVTLIPKGRLEGNQVGGAQFIREQGTTQILPNDYFE